MNLTDDELRALLKHHSEKLTAMTQWRPDTDYSARHAPTKENLKNLADRMAQIARELP